MRKLLTLILLLLPTMALARQSAQGDCVLGGKVVVVNGLNSTTKVMASYPSCQVQVNIQGGGLATIYSDNNGTVLANPFTATTAGHWQWYADNGRYSVLISGGTPQAMPSSFTYSDIVLDDNAQSSTTVCGLGFNASITFTAAACSDFTLTLSGNVTSSTVTGAIAGQQIVVSLCQDATGSRTFAWPPSFTRPPTISAVAGSCTNATFFFDGAAWRQSAATGDSFIASNGGTFSGTFGGTPTFTGSVGLTGGGSLVGTFSGNHTLSGNVIYTGSVPITVTGDNPVTLGGLLSARQMLGTFDVRRYGALCDGVTNDTTAIQSAITAAAAAGGIVRLPIGTCKANVTLPNGVTLQGAGFGWNAPGITPIVSKLLTAVAGTSPVIDITLTSNIENSVIEHLLVNGNGTGATDIGIRIPNASNGGTVEITDVAVTTTGQQGILQSGPGGHLIVDHVLVQGALNDRTSAIRRGACEVHAANAQFNQFECGAGLLPGGAVTNAALNNCGLLVDGNYGNYVNGFAELAEAGVCLTSAAGQNLFTNVNANAVAGHGWICAGCTSNYGVNNLASNFSQAAASTYDGWNFDATSSGNSFIGSGSIINGGFLAARYGINDQSVASPGNNWNTPLASGAHTAPVNFANFGTSSLFYPGNFLFVAAGATTFDASQRRVIRFLATTPHTFTAFTNGVNTQELILLGNANVTIQNNATINTASAADLLLEANKTYRFTNFNGVWTQDGTERDLTLNTLVVGSTLSVTGLSTLTGGFKAGASGSTISDSRELLQNAHSCGTTAVCANTTNGSYREVFGSVALVSGTPSAATIAGISPAFTSAATYFCTATPQGTTSAVAAGGIAVSNVSGSSFTLTGPATVTTVVNYHCIGN